MEHVGVDFTLGREGASFLRKGWADPEKGFCWMVGLESVISFPRPTVGLRYKLSLKVEPHIRGEKLSRQTLVCLVNGVLAGLAELTDVTTLDWEVPTYALDLDETVTIRLIHPNAASPREIAGLGDDRKLAIALKTLKFTTYSLSTPALEAKGKSPEAIEPPKAAPPPVPAASPPLAAAAPRPTPLQRPRGQPPIRSR